MMPGAYAAGGLGPTFAGLSRESEIVIVRSYCFSRFYGGSGPPLASQTLHIPVETKYAPVCGMPANGSATLLHVALHLAVRVAPGHVVALVVVLFALAQGDLHLHAPILQIDAQGNERQALLHHGLL